MTDVLGDCEWPTGVQGAAPGNEPRILLCGKPAKDRTPLGALNGKRRIPVCPEHLSLASYNLQRSRDRQAST